MFLKIFCDEPRSVFVIVNTSSPVKFEVIPVPEAICNVSPDVMVYDVVSPS